MARRLARLKRKAEGLTTIMRLALVGGSAYLLYRKYRRDQMEEAMLQQQAQVTGGSVSAMQPLVAPSAETLPHQQATTVAYQPATNDQLDTTRQLQTPQIQNLDPSLLAKQALSYLQTNL